MGRIIVVPLDGSELAETALPHAATLARACGSSLVLLRAMEPSIFYSLSGEALGVSSDGSWDEEVREGNRYLNAVATRQRRAGLTVQTALVEGDATSAIVGYAGHAEVEMICMATHGRSGVGRWIFGSVAEKVLHSVTVPLLLVRPQPGQSAVEPVVAQSYSAILVTLDGSPLAEQALGPAQTIARATGAHLELLSVVPGPDQAHRPGGGDSRSAAQATRMQEYLSAVAQKLESSGLTVETHIAHGRAAETILAASSTTDMTALATHGRSGLQRLWLGSVAMKVLQGAHRPVMLVRAQTMVG